MSYKVYRVYATDELHRVYLKKLTELSDGVLQRVHWSIVFNDVIRAFIIQRIAPSKTLRLLQTIRSEGSGKNQSRDVLRPPGNKYAL